MHSRIQLNTKELTKKIQPLRRKRIHYVKQVQAISMAGHLKCMQMERYDFSKVNIFRDKKGLFLIIILIRNILNKAHAQFLSNSYT